MFLSRCYLLFGVLEISFALTIHTIHEEEHKKHIPILKQDFQIHHEGYQYGFEASNGIKVHETGYIKNKGDKEHEILVQQGKVTYHDEYGHPITLTYIADENGFQPQGDHLPTPPPNMMSSSKHAEDDEAQGIAQHIALQDALNAQQYVHYYHHIK